MGAMVSWMSKGKNSAKAMATYPAFFSECQRQNIQHCIRPNSHEVNRFSRTEKSHDLWN